VIPKHWSQEILEVDGNGFNYYRTGSGGKPPLVLAHGFSDNGLCWLQTALDLEDRYDIIMPDARGHGLSARVQPGESVDMAADLAGIIGALGMQDPVVGGHSMGAMTAFQLGLRWPELPRALILEDPPFFNAGQRPQVNPDQEHPMAPWVETVTRLTLDELLAQTREEHPSWPEWVINTWTPAKKQLDPNILSILRIEGWTWEENVPRLACPTLVVTADPQKGGIVTPEIAAKVESLNHRCKVVHIPGTGHHVRFEDYQTYMGALRTFLERTVLWDSPL